MHVLHAQNMQMHVAKHAILQMAERCMLPLNVLSQSQSVERHDAGAVRDCETL